jgi:hypothetical protein
MLLDNNTAHLEGQIHADYESDTDYIHSKFEKKRLNFDHISRQWVFQRGKLEIINDFEQVDKSKK